MQSVLSRVLLMALATSVICLGFLAGSAKAADDEHPLVAPPSADEVLAWIEQLSSTSYSQREQASLSLLAAGQGAIPHLQQSVESPDLEVALRSQRILSAIQTRIVLQRRAAFLEAEDPGDVAPFGWKNFQQLVGDTQMTREFFLGMHEAEPELMLAAERRREDLTSLLSTRTEVLEESSFNQRQRGVINQPISSFSLASFFFLTTLDTKRDRLVVQRITQLINYSDLRTKMSSTPQREILMLLLSKYVAKQLASENADAGTQARTLLPLALNYGIQGILPVAVDLLKQAEEGTAKLDANVITYAAITVGRFGKPEDVEILLPHIPDKRVCHTYTSGNERRQTYAGDVALVMCLHLLRQEPQRYHFDILSASSSTIYQQYTMSFVDDEHRQKSRDAWEEFRKTGVPPEPPPKPSNVEKDDKKPLQAAPIKINARQAGQ